MPVTSCFDFRFRVWVHPKDGDPPEIEVWIDGLEDLKRGHSLKSEWASISFSEEDFHSIFALPPDRHWQVAGTARIFGSEDYYGEYSEEVCIIEFAKSEVPDWYIDELNEVLP